MGNALRFLCGDCFKPRTSEGAHEVVPGTTGFDLLARDLFQFENTAQVPEGLSQHVDAPKKTQATWYKKILAAWKEDPPSNAEQVAILIVKTLQKHHGVHVEGFLAFYGLPYPIATTQDPGDIAQKWPQEVKYEFHTLKVKGRAVLDGDSINVCVDTKSPRESAVVPISVQEATIERREARARQDYTRADALKKKIEGAGYRVFDASRNGDDVLARKYRIRLRGIDAPEGEMPYGKEAREALLNLVEGKCLRILVYGEDCYGRTVGDIYTGDVFVQEVLLKKGWVWHYKQYDKRPEFAEVKHWDFLGGHPSQYYSRLSVLKWGCKQIGFNYGGNSVVKHAQAGVILGWVTSQEIQCFTSWEKQARAARVGIWASANPQKPWDWRKERREGIAIETFA